MNLGSLSTAVKRFGFDDEDPLSTWINAAIGRILGDDDWPFMEDVALIALPSGDDALTLPADFAKPIKVRDITSSDYTDLEYYDVRRWYREITSPATGAPEFFTTYSGNVFRVWPTPSDARTLDMLYRKQMVELVNSVDIPEAIPTEFHYVIAQTAAYIGLQAENEEERAQTAIGEAEIGLDNMRRLYGSKQSGEPEYVTEVE